jgi:large subunit ribosomal protein L4
MHEALVAMRAARRSGSANTKTKAEVNLSGANRGAKRHGPRPGRLQVIADLAWWRRRLRSQTARLFEEHFQECAPPRFSKSTERADSRRRCVNRRSLAVKEPKTKAFVSLLKGHTDSKKVLLISDSFDENFYRSARNVKPVLLATAVDVNTEQLLAFDKIIVTEKALEQLAERTTRK